MQVVVLSNHIRGYFACQVLFLSVRIEPPTWLSAILPTTAPIPASFLPYTRINCIFDFGNRQLATNNGPYTGFGAYSFIIVLKTSGFQKGYRLFIWMVYM